MGNSCNTYGTSVIEQDIQDVDGDNVGQLVGMIVKDRDSLHHWMEECGMTVPVINSLTRTTGLCPVAILNRLHVSMHRRGVGHGKLAMTYFDECAIEEDSRTSLAIIDLNETQRKDFDVIRWMEMHGYSKLGYTTTGAIVMFRRYR